MDENLIEARRTAVAVELLCQSQSIYRDEEQTGPDLALARTILANNPALARGAYRRADALIAAYEGARA